MGLRLERIHSDNRGEIYLIKGPSLKEHEEIVIFITNKGYARGGCIHNINDERSLVLEGNVTYFLDEEEEFECGKGTYLQIDKATPHYFIAREDSIVMEWGATPEEKKNKHEETRVLVNKINEEMDGR